MVCRPQLVSIENLVAIFQDRRTFDWYWIQYHVYFLPHSDPTEKRRFYI